MIQINGLSIYPSTVNEILKLRQCLMLIMSYDLNQNLSLLRKLMYFPPLVIFGC